jgi:glycosyltransferase involved in cell wall biosynthesis
MTGKTRTNESSPFPPKPARAAPVPLNPLPECPLVSIIVPSYNQGRFIRATLDSILKQDYRPIEILVIDGASTDQTVDVLRSYGNLPELDWVSEPDHGVVHAVNKGFAKSRGDIVAIQSSDDCYLPGAITRAVAEFRHHPGVGLVYGDTVKVDAQGDELARYRIGPYSLENLFLLKTWIPQPSAFFRRELLDAVGGWDERIPYAPDTGLWIRMAFRTEVHKIDEYLSQRRMHDEQRDVQSSRIVRDYTKMIEQSSDIREACAAVKRAAHAGKYLLRLRYNTRNSDWYAARSLLQAGLVDRRCLSIVGIGRHLVYFPVRKQLSRCKRWLLGTIAH